MDQPVGKTLPDPIEMDGSFKKKIIGHHASLQKREILVQLANSLIDSAWRDTFVSVPKTEVSLIQTQLSRSMPLIRILAIFYSQIFISYKIDNTDRDSLIWIMNGQNLDRFCQSMIEHVPQLSKMC